MAAFLGLWSSAVSAQVSIEALQQAQIAIDVVYAEERAALEAWAKERNLTMRWVDGQGREIELMGIDETGMPIYFITNNIVAAHSTSTSRVWPGAVLGYSLAGQGMTVGEWDGGGTRVTHQELVGRATQIDNPTGLSSHATHVAGTMIAAGVVANARGMANQANLATYDWNSDNAEMAAAGQNGLLVSNHSYGQIAGWSNNNGTWRWYGNTAFSETEDWNFGFYNSKAQQWDQIARNNPYYLIVKSAGNNRNNGPNPGTTHQVRNASGAWVTSTTVRPRVGPYDCLPTYSTAKNILTIGAVNDLPNGWTSPAAVSMSSFSSWGPTDDGRIKPDVVGNGVGLYSSYSGSNTQYSSISGTSMSGPNVAGSLILLQQHYQDVHNQFMLSSTLKALTLHTADEAGPDPGPDYMFGWGLMNTAKAVQLIDNSDGQSLLEEHLLENQGEVSMSAWHPAAGPLRVTIAWTDPAGTPPPAALNPANFMLVNDLDMRLIHVPTGTIYSPYTLDPANRTAAAQMGDNFRDNVEQVYIANAPAGEYIVRIDHKAALQGNNAQAFGLVATGLVKGTEANFGVDKQVICVGDSVQFTSTSTGATSFSWLFPGGSPSSDTVANPLVTYPLAGLYTVSLRINGPQGSDSITRMQYVRVGVGLELPFTEDFEGAEPESRGWTIVNPDSNFTWERFTVGGTSPGNQAMRMNFYAYNSVGQRDYLVSPALNLNGLGSASLRFDHAYRAYSASNADSMIISISTDCQQSWSRLVAYGPNDMATLANGTNAFAPTLATSWCGSSNPLACFNVPLDSFISNPLVYIRFEGWNGYGNNLYIDNIGVNGVPNIPPQASFSSDVAQLCAGNTVSFSNQSSGVPTAFNWSFPGGTPAFSTDSDPVVLYSMAGTYPVQLIVTNAVGADTLLMTGAVRVDSLPAVSLTALNPMCTSDALLNLSGGAPAGGYYSGTGVVGANQFDPALAGPGIHDINYTFTENGCIGNAIQQVVVTQTPTPSLAILLPSCVDLPAYPLAGGSPVGGLYSGPGVSNGIFDPAAAGVGTHIITYAVTDNGCVGHITRSLSVLPFTAASIVPIPTLCDNASNVLLSAVPSGGQWSGSGVTFGIFNPSLAGPGLHEVIYSVNNNGCLTADTVQVLVEARPVRPEISLDGLELVSSATQNNQWYRDGAAISGATQQRYAPQQVGSYQVLETNQWCESQLSDGFDVLNVSVRGLEQAGIKLYPNPSGGRATLDLRLIADEPGYVEIRNAMGQLIQHYELQAEQSALLLELEAQAEGVYLVRWIGLDRIYTTRLMLVK